MGIRRLKKKRVRFDKKKKGKTKIIGHEHFQKKKIHIKTDQYTIFSSSGGNSIKLMAPL